MFQNFFKIAIRNIIRQKTYALINIFGLAIGIACSILIALFIFHESSFDAFHDKSDQIYQLLVTGRFADAEFKSANTAVPSGPVFLDEIPEVINFTRIERWDNILVRHGKKTSWKIIFTGRIQAFSKYFHSP